MSTLTWPRRLYGRRPPAYGHPLREFHNTKQRTDRTKLRNKAVTIGAWLVSTFPAALGNLLPIATGGELPWETEFQRQSQPLQNCRQKVFKRVLYVCAGRLERLCRGLNPKSLFICVSYFNLWGLGALFGLAKLTNPSVYGIEPL